MSSEGKLAVPAVNRFTNRVAIRHAGGLQRVLRKYVYSRETVAKPDRGLISASDVVQSGALLSVGPQSFVALRDVD